MSIKPLGNRVLVRRSKAETKKGNILLPDSAQEKPKEGTVISAGPGKRNDEGHLETLHVKEGDCILFSSYAGTEVQNSSDQENEFLILSEDDILGILTK